MEVLLLLITGCPNLLGSLWPELSLLLINIWFTWVFLLVGTDRPAAVLLWSFCHHEIPCLFHLKFYFSPWILNKVLGCFVAWFCGILCPIAGPLFCLYMYVPLSAIAWMTVHALKFVLCAVSMVLCDFFPCSTTLLIIQVCYFMASACGLVTEVIGAIYGLHAYFRLLFWATTKGYYWHADVLVASCYKSCMFPLL